MFKSVGGSCCRDVTPGCGSWVWYWSILCWHSSLIPYERFRGTLRGNFSLRQGMREILKISKFYFTVSQPLKNYVAGSCLWVWWHSAKLKHKLSKSICKITFFEFFACADEGGTKKAKFQKFSYTTLQTFSNNFCVFAFSSCSTRPSIQFMIYFKIVIKN